MEQSNINQDQRFMSDSIDQLATSLSKAQGEFLVAIPSIINTRFEKKYCIIDDLVTASRPALSKYGLSVTQGHRRDKDGILILVTDLVHNSGQWKRSEMPITPENPKDPQKVLTYNTYMVRESYKCITGVVSRDDSDDDGESLVHKQKINKPKNISTRITEDQLKNLLILSEEDQQIVLSNNGVSSLEDIAVDQYYGILTWYNKKYPE